MFIYTVPEMNNSSNCLSIFKDLVIIAQNFEQVPVFQIHKSASLFQSTDL